MLAQTIPAPASIAATGIERNDLLMLALKSMYVTGASSTSAISDVVKLPASVVNELIDDAHGLKLLDITAIIGPKIAGEIRCALTVLGREWASDATAKSQYVGPAPVSLDAFRDQAARQGIANEAVPRDRLRECLASLVIPPETLVDLGPAIRSNRAILLYGPPGNGKTSIAHAVTTVFEQSILVPHCIDVDGQIIKIFDSTLHRPVEIEPAETDVQAVPAAPPVPAEPAVRTGSRLRKRLDERWVACRRPAVITGGELSLEMLDLIFNPGAGFYEAPMQLKATGGIFVIDDFGRQLVSPKEMLNRWVVPLENRVDYLTLHTGKKFPVPFDELVVFSTNLPPADLLDSAMMRRVPYKLKIDGPTRADYEEIFARECSARGIGASADVLDFLFDEFYGAVEPARFHPRFIVDHVVARCQYEGVPLALDRDHVAAALRNLSAD